jgi:hypothetical protein
VLYGVWWAWGVCAAVCVPRTGASPPPPRTHGPPVADEDEDNDDDDEDLLYSRRLEAGLFTLQHVDAMIAILCSCDNPQVRHCERWLRGATFFSGWMGGGGLLSAPRAPVAWQSGLHAKQAVWNVCVRVCVEPFELRPVSPCNCSSLPAP